MKGNNRVKALVGVSGIVLVAVYTYFLFAFGGEYLSGTEYIFQAGITLFLSLLVTSLFKSKLAKDRKIYTLLTGITLVLGLFIISGITGSQVRYNAEMLVIAVWPLICFWLAKCTDVGKKIGCRLFVWDFLTYNIITIGLIIVFEEIIFKYECISADVTAQMYMYMMAVITFIIYAVRIKKTKLDKWDVLCILVTVAAVSALWLVSHERIVSITESLNYSKTDVYADGEFKNWISHRTAMIKTVLNGDFSNINIYRVHSLIKGCTPAWLSSVGGVYVPVVIFLLNVIIASLMVAYAKKTGNVLISVITISLVLKLIIGVITNMFLIFSTVVGVPLIRNVYDIVLLVTVLNFDFTTIMKKLC